jgi:hypothetical protein
MALLIAALAVPLASPVAAQNTDCSDYSTQASAQFALEINPSLAPTLDPDGNGTACDHEGATGATTPTSGGLQLPTDTSQTPTPSGAAPQATVDAVDQQPTTSTGAQTQPANTVLAGRLGDTQQSFAAVHGAVTEEQPSDSSPSVTLRVYTPPATAFDLYTIDWEDRVAIVVVVAEESWTTTDAAAIIGTYMPTDVTTLPQPETLADGSLLISTTSQQLATALPADFLSQAGLPGTTGDLYMLLFTDGAGNITEIEIGLGNGDNVRESAASSTATSEAGAPTPGTNLIPTTAPAQPTPTATAAAAAPDATTFLQNTRTEVDELQGQIDQLRAIISAGTFTETENDQLSQIIVSWMAIDTSMPVAPPEHSDIATQLQQIRGDLSNIGATLFTGLTTGDMSGIEGAATLLNTIEANLQTLDQELTALGF